ncbi:5-demethoxyubiquinone hydroxylase, mitochondrial isoform X1 [Ahaetulla prasina]|uniref:5-demethoxyubiquinone hydroxylase, mitochondrial isoform X1 n=1 Tax=Ahaetulla prasina TaxID=499056 RepID=UPI002648B277|nr:5-demethoxyubiquinone hydroxylase, mitochondrial isoform X1 [Ahaetulla prasina]
MAKAAAGCGLLLIREQCLLGVRWEGAKRRWGLQFLRSPYRFCSSRIVLDDINKPMIDRIIRVDHAGEYGANRIYAGQMAVLGRSSVGPVIRQMWEQEKDHLKQMKDLVILYRVRPTILLPLWDVAGYMLGAGTALLGKKAAMACTVAVEESVAVHYNNQIRVLVEEDPEKYKELLQIIKKFRDEEMEHHDTGLEYDAELVSWQSTRFVFLPYNLFGRRGCRKKCF